MSSPPEVSPDLLARVKQQDDAGCRELVDQLYPVLHRVVCRNLPRDTAPEDILQDVFVKIFSSIASFRGQQPFGHWASRIATLTCYDALRKQYRRPNLSFSDLPPEEVRALQPSHSPHRDLEEKEASRALVDRLLATLNPREQLVLRLSYLEELSTAEIQTETGWSASKIKVTALRARQKLQKHLSQLPSS